jgi:hypothetical protein
LLNLFLEFVSALEYAQDVVFPKDEMLFALELDLASRILAEQDLVAGFDLGRDQLAVFVLALPDGNHFALLRLFLCRVRDDNSALGFLFLGDSFD